MHHNIRIISFLVFLLFSFEIYGQSENSFEPKIIPPSPTAYELGRYGQTDVGTFTGTPNISVPLYTYKTKNIAIPISLGYNSNGIQVDQMETNVGLGWNLNTGGIINRVVRGKADEDRSVPISEENCLSDNFIIYMDNNQFNDLQPDLYSYNFQGHSGQFVFDNNNKAVLVPQNNLKIEKFLVNNQWTFKITTEDGVEYQFNDTEYSTWENVEAPQTVATGWYLTKIIHPQGDIVNFSYKNYNYYYPSNVNQSFVIKVSEERCDAIPPMHFTDERSENGLSIIGKIIENISSNDSQFGSVSFLQRDNPNIVGNYLISGVKILDREQNIIEKADFNYFFTANKRIFLSECIFKDTSKKYSFEYEAPDDLVARLSDQRDLWGYYNGKPGIYPDAFIHKDLYPQTNPQMDLVRNAISSRSLGDKRSYFDFAKKGILKKIVYPTKGYNEFEYESNSIWGIVESPCQVETTNKWFYNPEYSRQEQTEIFTFENKTEYETEIQAKVSYNDFDLTPGEFPEGELVLTVKIENLTNPSPEYNITFNASKHNIPEKRTYKFLKNATYRVTMVFSPEPKTTGQVNFKYCNGGGVESNANIPMAGLRIKEITSYDTTLNLADVKHYYYGKKETPNVSTGVEGVKMNILSYSEIRRICPDNVYVFEKKTNIITVSPNSLYPLYRSIGNSSTTYQNVTVSHGGANFENGGEELSYYTSPDIMPYTCYGSTLNSAPWINIGWKNGLLSKKKTFNNKRIDLNIIENRYKLQEQHTKEVSAIAYDFKYSPNIHFPNPNPRNIEHLNIAKYTTNSYWFYLESEENAQYDLEGLNPVTTKTEYKYNNPQHKKLTSQIFTNSLNEKLETKYFYPQDPEMATEPLRNELIAKNMIGLVLDTQTFKQGTKLSEQKTIYDQSGATSNLLLPRFIGVNKGVNAVDLNLDKKITYDQYDEKGNILQYTLESGIPVSIIWGYNKTQPIAKIENLSYNLIPSGTIATLQTLSNADIDNCMSLNCTEQLLRNGLNAFRNSLPDAFISTYTYNPLVGVTSVTDPKGIASYYEYNTYGRLKFVKDKDLNVLQKYCYNYRGQQVDCSDNTSTSVILYKSSARSGSFTKNNCSSGGEGATVIYSQEEGVSTSTTSQADADSQGLEKFNTDGQVYANTNTLVKCNFINTAQSRLITRNNCAVGGSPASVWYTVAAGTYTSDVSQAAADAQAVAQIDANGQAFANSDANAKCTFWNTAQSRLITRNNCAAGGSPASVWYTVAAGIYSSDVSQAAADAQAIAQIDNNGQAFANNDINAKCIFYSGALGGSFTKNNCDMGGYGSIVPFSQVAGTVSSNISQADADAQALNIFNANGQNNANATGYCTFYSPAVGDYFAKDNCTVGGAGSSVYYSQGYGVVYSYNSQAEANALGNNKFNVDGKAYANANGDCTFQSAAIPAQVFQKSNCTMGGVGSYVNYSLPAGAVILKTSKADVDNRAWTKFQTEGLANANTYGDCTFRSAAISGTFKKNTCVGGSVGSYVGYALAEGAIVLKTSQADVDSKALAKLNAEGQANANASGQCLFYNVYTQRSIRRTYCPRGTNGTVVIYSVSPGTYSSLISQADANQQAESEIDRQGQGYADRNGVCNPGDIEEI